MIFFFISTLVGTHVINTIHKFLYQPITKRDREAAEKKKLQAAMKKRMEKAQGKHNPCNDVCG